MKKTIQESLKQFVADRQLLVLVSVLILLALTFSISIAFSVRPSELQLVSHYSAFGVTHFYFDQWFYLLVFVLFGAVVGILHAVIAIKLLTIKGHSIAAMFSWFGIGIILLGWVTALAVINVWKPL